MEEREEKEKRKLKNETTPRNVDYYKSSSKFGHKQGVKKESTHDGW